MYAIISDIHGNLYALESVFLDMEKYSIDGVILLGDIIDYGMQSNEVVEFLKNNIGDNFICNIWRNHKNAIMTNDYSMFSSQRGKDSAKYTASVLSESSKKYLTEKMDHCGKKEFSLAEKKILAVHGSQNDFFWKPIFPEDVNGDYSGFDIVLSGHSHYSHCFYKFYSVDDPEKRNKHAVLFINPGSVGQPRNHNPAAQYALLDINTRTVILRTVEYDVDSAMMLYDGSVDGFYKTRLKSGI